jgi:cell division protein FtsI/penicillin-binding protein 2
VRAPRALAALALVVSTVAAPALGKPAGKVRASKDVDLASIRLEGGRARAKSVPDGTDVALTLDPELQRAAMRALEKSRAPSGAVVMSDVRTGRILVWAAIGSEGDLVRKAKYPGASLFKVVTSAALIDGGEVKATDVVCFQGGESRLEEADLQPGCHAGDVHVRFDKALGKSINAVFGKLALAHLDQAELDSMSRAFGIGQSPPIDVPVEATSIRIPKDRLGLARAAAGFGRSKMSPLAALDVMQTIANKGERIRFHVTGNPASIPRVALGHPIDEETAQRLVRMLEVTTRVGTSAKAFEPMEGKPDVSVAGKTGTLAYEKPKRLVSWFAGFAPSREPEVAVAVLLANDEKWWKKANEVARQVLDAHFERKRTKKD